MLGVKLGSVLGVKLGSVLGVKLGSVLGSVISSKTHFSRAFPNFWRAVYILEA